MFSVMWMEWPAVMGILDIKWALLLSMPIPREESFVQSELILHLSATDLQMLITS